MPVTDATWMRGRKLYCEWARKDQGKPDRRTPLRYSRSTQAGGALKEEGDMEAVVKKGDEPREAAGEEGKVEHKKAERQHAEGHAYPAEGVHGDNHPVDKARVRDDAGGKACEKIKAVPAGLEREEEGDEGDVGKVELGHGRLADDKQHAREEGERYRAISLYSGSSLT